MESVLRSLRDIDGVLGSFLLDAQGQLVAQDMPSLFDQATLAYASARLCQLRAALESGTGCSGFESCTARFGGHLLLLRAAQASTLCVLCPLGTNLNTLQMGLNLVARRVAGLAQSVPPKPPAPRATPAARPPQPAPDAREPAPSADPGSTTRFFRGRPVP